MNNGFDTTLIVFAFVAVFVLWKLRSVLGVRIDVERKPPLANAASHSVQTGEMNEAYSPRDGVRASPAQNRFIETYAKSDSARAGLTAICVANRGFDVGGFVDGAATAYRWIVEAFASGDRAKLRSLLSPVVYANFESEIARREQRNEHAHVKIHSIENVEIVDAQTLGRIVQITVRIQAKISNWTTGPTGEAIGGDPDLQHTTEEFWTFSRPLADSDPNWLLIATEHLSPL